MVNAPPINKYLFTLSPTKMVWVLQESAMGVSPVNLSGANGSKDPHVLPTFNLTLRGTADAYM